ncbi:MAG: VOC family protein [Bauldia sp.]
MTASVIPTLRYRDARKAIDVLCEVFGFERNLVYEDEGLVTHAELRLGNGMIMIGSVRDDNPSANSLGTNIVQPDQIGGAETQTSYLVVDDADSVHARARKAGFTMVLDLKDESYGGRGFTCRDHEGRLWSVGTYDPFTQIGI